MSRTVTVYGATLVALLVGSYLSWTSEDTGDDEGGVTILNAEPEDIERIVYRSEKLDLDIDVQSDDAGRFLWTKSVQRREKRSNKDKPDDGHGHGDGHGHDAPKKDGAKKDGPKKDGAKKDGEADAEATPTEEPAPEIEVIEKTFKAGEAGDDLLEGFAPFLALRRLEAGGDKLEEMEISEDGEVVELHRAGGAKSIYDLGGEAYGTRDRYVRDRGDGGVYLVSKDAVASLKRGATSLPDRVLMGVEPEAITQVVVAGPLGSATLEHVNRDDRAAAAWRVEGETDDDESAGTWLDKAFKLRASGYVQPQHTPKGKELAFSITATSESGETVTLAISTGTDENDKDAWYGQSEHTRRLVKLHTAPTSQVAEDLETVLE